MTGSGGDQYAAASRLDRRLWNTGSSAGACHRAAIRPTRWRTMTICAFASLLGDPAFDRRAAGQNCEYRSWKYQSHSRHQRRDTSINVASEIATGTGGELALQSWNQNAQRLCLIQPLSW